jgi:hypothetical protein
MARHRRRKQLCLALPLPPNAGMCLHALHCPQLGEQHAEHAPHRERRILPPEFTLPLLKASTAEAKFALLSAGPLALCAKFVGSCGGGRGALTCIGTLTTPLASTFRASRTVAEELAACEIFWRLRGVASNPTLTTPSLPTLSERRTRGCIDATLGRLGDGRMAGWDELLPRYERSRRGGASGRRVPARTADRCHHTYTTGTALVRLRAVERGRWVRGDGWYGRT